MQIGTTSHKTPGVIRTTVKCLSLTEPPAPTIGTLLVNHGENGHFIPIIKPTGTIGYIHVLAIEVKGGAATKSSCVVGWTGSGRVVPGNRVVVITGFIFPETD